MADENTFGTDTNLSALGTSLGSVGRFDIDDTLAEQFCLVFYETLQLEKTPIRNPAIQPFSPVFVPYSLQIFHNNSVSVGANNLFADIMVYPSHEPSFPARDFFEQSLCRPCAFGLNFTTQELEFSLDIFSLWDFEKSSVGTDSEIVDSQINSERGIAFGSWNIFAEIEQKISSAIAVHPQQTFGNIPTEIFGITFGNVEWKFYPAFDGGNAQKIAFNTGISWKIILYGTLFDERFAFGFLDDSAGLLYAGNCHLAWQSHSFELPVNQRMQFNVVPDFIFPSGVNAELHCLPENLQSFNYFRNCWNLDFCSYSNHFIVENVPNLYKLNGVNRQFIPQINLWVSLPREL